MTGLRAERWWCGVTVVVAAILGVVTIRNPDIFWHLAAGRWILEHAAIPHTDPLRFTAVGLEWIDHEWLFQLVVATVERVGGLDLLAAARVLLVVGLAAVLYAGCRRAGTPAAIAAAVVALALAVIRARLYLRPELVTFAGLALLLTALEHRASPRRWRMGAGVLLVVVWANAHPGALVAPIVVGLYGLGTRFSPEPWRWRWIIGGPLGTAALLMANPYGPHIFAVPGSIAASLAGLDATNPDWAPSWTDPDPTFVVVALAWLLAFAGAARARTLHLPTALVAVATLGLGVLQARQQPLFAIAAVFALGHMLAGKSSRWAPLLGSGTSLLVVVWGVLGVPALGRVGPQPGWGLEPGRYPERLVAQLAHWPDLGHLYNDPVVGGYIAWAAEPPRKIFIDTRNELGADLLHELGAARRDGRAWQDLLEHWSIDGALVRYDRRPVPVFDLDAAGRPVPVGASTIHRLLFPPEQFVVVGFDDRMMLLVRRTPERAQRLDAESFEALHPEDLEGSLARALADPERADRLRVELERQLSIDPDSQVARGLRAALEHAIR